MMRVTLGLVALLLAASCAETTVISGKDLGEKGDAVDIKKGEMEDSDVVIIGSGDVKHDGKAGNDMDSGDSGTVDLDEPNDIWDAEEGTELPDVKNDGKDVPPEIEVLEIVDMAEVEEVQDVPDVEEVKETKPETVCTPSCKNKECGSDGCDGVCGFCAYGDLCTAQGKCQANACQAACMTVVGGEEVGKDCGPDACGGYCGYCLGDGAECGTDGFCYDAACKPDCEKKKKECGPDGCGESCGFCAAGEWCNEQFKCVPHPCGDITSFGKCTDEWTLLECVNMAPLETMCKQFETTPACGWNEAEAKFTCIPKKACEKLCTFQDSTPKECGPDGCMGLCGVCPTGWGCFSGLCKPAEGATCGYIDSSGQCIGNVRWFCSAAKLYDQDCTAIGKTCKWNAQSKAVECL